MSTTLLTVDGVSERLGLHPKTILRFIREGRLRATRVGKSWRILETDLQTLVGAPAGVRETPRVTAVAEMTDIAPTRADRVSAALQALAMAPAPGRSPIQLNTVFDTALSRLTVIIVADARDAASLLQTLAALVEATP